VANDGSYAEYENNGNYDEGLDDSYDAFHDDITAAYFECMSAGLDGSDDHIIQITTLSIALANAIKKYLKSAKIDTEVTIEAGQALTPGEIPEVGPIEEQEGTGKGHLEFTVKTPGLEDKSDAEDMDWTSEWDIGEDVDWSVDWTVVWDDAANNWNVDWNVDWGADWDVHDVDFDVDWSIDWTIADGAYDIFLSYLKVGIAHAKGVVQLASAIQTDEQDPETIIDELSIDMAAAIHAYTKSATVITKSDIHSGKLSTDPLCSPTGTTQTDGDAEGIGQGGLLRGLTELDKDILYEGIKDAYLSMMEAAKTEVADPSMSDDEKKEKIEKLIYDILADKFCTTIKDYVTGAVVKTDVAVLGGVEVSGGVHTSLTAAAQGSQQDSTGITLPHIGTGVGEVS